MLLKTLYNLKIKVKLSTIILRGKTAGKMKSYVFNLASTQFLHIYNMKLWTRYPLYDSKDITLYFLPYSGGIYFLL